MLVGECNRGDVIKIKDQIFTLVHTSPIVWNHFEARKGLPVPGYLHFLPIHISNNCQCEKVEGESLG